MIQGNKKEIKEMTLKEWTEMMTGTDGQLDKHLLFYCLRTAFAISAQYVASRVRKSSQTRVNKAITDGTQYTDTNFVTEEIEL